MAKKSAHPTKESMARRYIVDIQPEDLCNVLNSKYIHIDLRDDGQPMLDIPSDDRGVRFNLDPYGTHNHVLTIRSFRFGGYEEDRSLKDFVLFYLGMSLGRNVRILRELR